MKAPAFDRAQVVVLSSIDWDAAWQRHQAFAAQWAASGRDVFFVENTGFRSPRVRDAARILNKAKSLLAPKGRRLNAVPPGVRVVNPLVLPPTRGAFRTVNEKALVPRLARKLKKLGLRDAPIVVAYLPTATTLELIKTIKPRLTVYDCVANFAGHPSAPADLAETEKALLGASALVVTDSSTLFAEKARAHPNVLELHHGVAPEFFLPDSPDPAYRRLCYFGTLWSALDYGPIAALGEAGFAVNLIGPVKEPLPPLPTAVRAAGAAPHAELPRLLAREDVLLLPYRAGAFSRGVIPAKLYECLATGRPVIASPLPALEGFKGLLYTTSSPAEWVKTVSALPRTESPELAQARRQAAREHSLDRQFAKLRQRVASAWEGAARA